MVEVEHLQRITSETELASSKGNQNKWYSDGKWYKEDGQGYEALAEVLVSRLLIKTNVRRSVMYQYEPLLRNQKVVHGCVSENFMEPDDRGIYDEAILRRVEDTIRMQIRKYRYMFS